MNIWNDCPKAPITELLTFIVDNRGKTVPTSETGHVLIATNCIKTDSLYPKYEKVRYLSQETYDTFFRAHPIPGDIIFVNKGTPGRTCLVPNPVDFCIAQDMIALRCDESKIYNKYLLAVLRSSQIQRHIYNTSVGDVIPHFKKQFMDTIEIPLPTYEYQKWIGDLYYNLSNKIELNNKINAQLEEMAQAIFKSWFVDFEPFKDGKFVESELGLIPEGWRVGTYKDITIGTVAGDWGKETPQNNYTHEVACVRGCDLQDIKNGVRGKTPQRYILEKNYQAKHLCDKDILVEISGGTATVSTGRIALVTEELLRKYNGDIVCTNFCRVLRPLKEYSSYIYYSWDYKYNNRVMFGYENGTSGIKNFAINDFLEKELVIIPKEDDIYKFQHFIDTLHQKIQMNGSESTHLAQLRDTLLPKLMNGEIEI